MKATWLSLEVEAQSQPDKSNDNALALINLTWKCKVDKKVHAKIHVRKY